ncbi:MAG TPA: YHS domain-containing protein, partial [Gemmataceae bacterium]|nr:YHS domain-containing protein [Gemmataceae bacterium]
MSQSRQPPAPKDDPFAVIPDAGSAAVDPVCGMTVNPATARAQTQYGGQTYYFCCPGCLQKFQADPQRYLRRAVPNDTHAETGHGHDYAVDPVCGMTVDPESAAGSTVYQGQTYYFCNPLCQQKFETDPKRYLGKAAPPVTGHESATGTQYSVPSTQHSPTTRDHSPATTRQPPPTTDHAPPTGTQYV